jgi:hypothetical protein
VRCAEPEGSGNSWDRVVVESPVAVVGAVDASSDDSEMVDSSRLTPTMAGSSAGYWRGRESSEAGRS